MTPVENRRAWLRAVPGLPMVDQIAMAAGHGCGAVYDAGTRAERELWIASLRPGDEAWTPRLDCLVLLTAERGKARPTADFVGVIAALMATGAITVEGTTGVRSDDAARWSARVQHVSQRLASSFRSRADLVAAGRKGGRKRADASVAAVWGTPARADDLDRQRTIWTSTRWTSDAEAAAALDPDLARYSARTLRDLLGPRRPGDKRAGGRPRKST